MTTMLQQAFEAASQLSDAEQDAIAARLLAEIEDEAFDRKLAQTSDKLAILAEEALAEHRAGRTLPLEESGL